VEIQLLSLTHGQCDARPTVRLPILHRTKLILLITDADVCEVLAQGCTLKCAGMRVEPARPTDRKSSALTNVPPSHTIKNQGKGRNRTDGMLRLVSPHFCRSWLLRAQHLRHSAASKKRRRLSRGRCSLRNDVVAVKCRRLNDRPGKSAASNNYVKASAGCGGCCSWRLSSSETSAASRHSSRDR